MWTGESMSDEATPPGDKRTALLVAVVRPVRGI